jgi:hypothetical protein
VLKAGDVVSLGEQIVLMYDAINNDPGATMASPRRSARVEAPPVYASTPVPAPTPVYSSAPGGSVAPASAPKKTNMVPIFIGVGALVFICMCIAFFVWVDQTYRWCVFFPFLSGC